MAEPLELKIIVYPDGRVIFANPTSKEIYFALENTIPFQRELLDGLHQTIWRLRGPVTKR